MLYKNYRNKTNIFNYISKYPVDDTTIYKGKTSYYDVTIYHCGNEYIYTSGNHVELAQDIEIKTYKNRGDTMYIFICKKFHNTQCVYYMSDNSYGYGRVYIRHNYETTYYFKNLSIVNEIQTSDCVTITFKYLQDSETYSKFDFDFKF